MRAPEPELQCQLSRLSFGEAQPRERSHSPEANCDGPLGWFEGGLQTRGRSPHPSVTSPFCKGSSPRNSESELPGALFGAWHAAGDDGLVADRAPATLRTAAGRSRSVASSPLRRSRDVATPSAHAPCASAAAAAESSPAALMSQEVLSMLHRRRSSLSELAHSPLESCAGSPTTATRPRCCPNALDGLCDVSASAQDLLRLSPKRCTAIAREANELPSHAVEAAAASLFSFPAVQQSGGSGGGVGRWLAAACIRLRPDAVSAAHDPVRATERRYVGVHCT